MLSEKTPASVEGGAGLPAASAPSSPYGDLTELNTSRVILDSVGKPLLHEIASNFMDLLGSSAAIYEKNSDYALGLFTSGWCRTLDCASRGLCGTADNMEALSCGKWLCHESCWSKATAAAIQSGEPVDVECAGGMHIYAMPIRAGAEVIGGINFGFGDPPRDESTLRELAEKYGVNVEELRRHAEAYETRPTFIIEMAKKRLQTAANLIGEIVQRKRAEAELAQKAKDLTRSNEELAQFAFVASHDLQEPLRKIGTFGDRLAAHSGGALDEQGRD